MIDWLSKIFSAAGSVIPTAVKNWVYTMIHGVAGLMNTVFGHVGDAWNFWWGVAEGAIWGFEDLNKGLWHALSVVKLTWIGRVITWAANWLSSLGRWIEDTIRWAARFIGYVRDLAWHWVQSAVHWAIVNIYDPLINSVVDLYHKMRQWAYVAWWYITHPAALVEALFWFGVDAAQRHIWGLAAVFGEFSARLFLANVPRVIALVERIAADVL